VSTALLMKQKGRSYRNITIVGVGNLLLGDEGVGLHIIDRLSQVPMPPYVNIIDCGCDLFGLTAYIDEQARILVVDAIRAGGEPGEIYTFDCRRLTSTKIEMGSAHQVKTLDALRLMKSVCPALAESEIVVIGVEPKTMKLGSCLSKEVSESIAEATRFVLEEIITLSKGKNMAAASILVIDDDPEFVELTKTVLEAQQYDVICAYDANEGAAKLTECIPDVILLDIMMGKGAEGFILARKIRKDHRFAKIPILMITSMREQTGFDFPGKPIHPKFLPVDEYIEKPFEPQALLEKIEQQLARRNAG